MSIKARRGNKKSQVSAREKKKRKGWRPLKVKRKPWPKRAPLHQDMLEDNEEKVVDLGDKFDDPDYALDEVEPEEEEW
jgi:hypothetical protein